MAKTSTPERQPHRMRGKWLIQMLAQVKDHYFKGTMTQGTGVSPSFTGNTPGRDH